MVPGASVRVSSFRMGVRFPTSASEWAFDIDDMLATSDKFEGMPVYVAYNAQITTDLQASGYTFEEAVKSNKTGKWYELLPMAMCTLGGNPATLATWGVIYEHWRQAATAAESEPFAYRSVWDVAGRDALLIGGTLSADTFASGERRLGMMVTTMNDGATYLLLTASDWPTLTNAERLAELSNNTNWRNLNGALAGTHATIKGLQDTNRLNLGQKYCVLDFELIHRVNHLNIINTSSPTEPLIIEATSSNTFSPVAYSVLHKDDEIDYDINNVLAEDGTTPRPGFINARTDRKRGIHFKYDWRYLQIPLFKAAPTVWVSGAVGTYNRHALVEHTGSIFYRCLVNGTAGTVEPSNLSTNTAWMTLWEASETTRMGKYIACRPTGFSISNAPCTVNAADYKLVYTFSAYTGINNDVTNNHASTLIKDVRVDAPPTVAGMYANNNIFFGMPAGAKVEDVQISSGGYDLTFFDQVSGFRMGANGKGGMFRKYLRDFRALGTFSGNSFNNWAENVHLYSDCANCGVVGTIQSLISLQTLTGLNVKGTISSLTFMQSATTVTFMENTGRVKFDYLVGTTIFNGTLRADIFVGVPLTGKTFTTSTAASTQYTLTRKETGGTGKVFYVTTDAAGVETPVEFA